MERNKQRNHYHLKSSDIGESILGKNHSPKNFYEGTIPFNGRDVLFFLQKFMPDDRTLAEVGIVMAEAALGNINHILSQDKTRIGSERYEHCLEASTLFEKHGVPESSWDKKNVTIAMALYNRFAEGANIVVPGYVNGVSIKGEDTIVSNVEPLHEREHLGLETLLRERNLNGKVFFWRLK